MTEQKPYTPAGTDITLRWKKKYKYVPASEQPEIAAKHKYYRELKWQNELTESLQEQGQRS